ncbi:unnamed protein product [Diabrotica balteata]|uniref:Uncharacterized protein n=1 Tax=Diabrotica balteata TaxID=107213 RepID=A0A9N9TCZ2_DIABA|nr:unnamed protein product [Diabrotica balteata]
MANQEPIMNKIAKRQMNWYGHLTRMQSNRITKKVYEAKNIGKRKRGRPRKKWIQQVVEARKFKQKSLEELKIMAGNRKEWKRCSTVLDRLETAMAMAGVHDIGRSSFICNSSVNNKCVLYSYCVDHMDEEQATYSHGTYTH